MSRIIKRDPLGVLWKIKTGVYEFVESCYTYVVHDVFEIETGGTFEIEVDGVLFIHEGTIVNDGLLINDGTIIN